MGEVAAVGPLEAWFAQKRPSEAALVLGPRRIPRPPWPASPTWARQGLKATFPRRSRWSPARPQSAPFTAVPAHSPEHLGVGSEGNQAVSVTCQEVSHDQCLFIS